MTTKQTGKPSPLGRGLSALFGDTDGAYQARRPLSVVGAEPQPQTETKPTTVLPIEFLQPGAFQPRRKFDDEPLQELAHSIRERGILQPLLVRPIKGEINAYEIVAGERRWRAAQLANQHEVPVVIRELTDREAMEIGLIENVQREGLSLLEESEGYRRLLQEFSYTQENLSKVVGKSRSHIANMIRLLALPDKIKGWIDQGALTMGHARAILNAKDPEPLAAEIIKRGLNVRQAEEMARRVEDKKKILAPKKTKDPVDANHLALEKELTQTTGLRVKLQSQGKCGALTLYYQDLDQLDQLILRLKQ